MRHLLGSSTGLLPARFGILAVFGLLLACNESSGAASKATAAPSAVSMGSGGQPTLGPDLDGPIVVERVKPMDSGATGSGGGGAQSTALPPLTLCNTNAGYSVSSLDGDSVFDDFENGSDEVASNGRLGYWYSYGDDTGVLLPKSDWAVGSPGHGASAYALHVGGQNFTDWGSGTGIGLASDAQGSCLHDASAYTGISFWARGSVVPVGDEAGVERDKGTVRFMLTEANVTPVSEGGGCDGNSGGCWDSHRVRFVPTECWQFFSFDFSEFEQDGWGQDGGQLDLTELYTMGFEIAANNDWDLWVDDIEFYAGKKPMTPMADCELNFPNGGAPGAL